MKFLPHDDEVEIYKTIFTEDILKRTSVSENLSSVVDKIEDPLVIALDGRWGTGKSYFLKRWVAAHREQNGGDALTVYFDAFASDYLSDPLPALVAALSIRAPKEKKDKLKRVKKAAIKFVKPIARVGLAMATYGATEILNDVGDAAAEAIEGEAKGSIDDFWKKEEGRQAAMDEFKASLASLTKGGEGDEDSITPVVIVVDELDRCRPDYALEVLEVIKHFFSVPYVHFVLGVNLDALENSVKARYGNGVDATSYLRKFISFTITLPDHVGDHDRTPASIRYAQHIADKMGIENDIKADLIRQINLLSAHNEISIREIGKIMSLASLLPEDSRGANIYPGWRIMLVSMLIAKVYKPNIYTGMVNSSVDIDDLLSYYGVDEDNLKSSLDDGSRNQNYNHVAYITIALWSFVIGNGKTNMDDSERSIVRLLSQFGDIHDAKSIPRRINEDWLSRISVQ